jgi:sugar phosphate isomerase/epimerase
MNRLGIEYLSVFGLPPVPFIELAADMGCASVSISANPVDYPHPSYERYSIYPRYFLRDQPELRRDVKAVLRDRDIVISLGEGFVIRPDADVSERARDVETMAELAAERINCVSMDPDVSRSFDQIAKFAEMAGAAGLEATVEPCPALTIRDLPMALDLHRHVGRPNFKLLIDTMHVIRGGSSPADVAALDPDIIGYVQICDAPLKPVIADYMEEAMLTRLPPGKGELPLLDLLKALPRRLRVSLEVPMRREYDAGVDHLERLAPCVEGARALLAQLEG